MKIILGMLWGAIVGIISTALGWGWFADGKFNAKGAVINLLLVIFGCTAIVYFSELIERRR